MIKLTKTHKQVLMIVLMFLVMGLYKFVQLLSTLTFLSWIFITLALIGVLSAILLIRKQRKLKLIEQRRMELQKNRTLTDLKNMCPFEFERYVCDLFKLMGYQASVTSRSNDGGKDIIIYKKDYLAIAECKRYGQKKVTRPDIQKFHSAIIDCGAEKGFYITTSDFTK